MDKFQVMKIVVEVAERKSFSRASQHLRLSPPVATRAVANLEDRLGVKLFNRTTRQVKLTEVGANYVADAKRILEEMERIEAAATGSHDKPKGHLCITAPVLFGEKHVAPIITEYLSLYPEVSLMASLLDRNVNLLDEGIDVAIRIGPLQDASHFAVRVGMVCRVVVGAPSYIETYGMPETPKDLVNHQIIQASTVEATTNWRFGPENQSQQVKVMPRLVINQNAAAVRAAKLGLGLSRLMSYQVTDAIEEGTLLRVLRDFETEALPVHVVHLQGRRANAKTRAFVDLAVQRLRENPFVHT